MSLISFSTIFLLCGCLFLKAFRFPSHTKLLTNPTQSGDMVSIFFLKSSLTTRLFSNLPASVNGEDDSIRSLDSKIKKIEDGIANLKIEIANLKIEIANLKIELSDTTNEQERILIRQQVVDKEQQIVEKEKQIVEKEKQLTAVLLSTGELIQTSQ